ncbi:type IV pilus modification protein PilV [Aquisalimonas sp.]|uniref:type IV pilus modification protein PilV n=1 Tax=Aquisalimonas sp. TaxID=1872621 RepID=UPI0025C24F74|nr:type IV pilus modification protein PilV [Aquisalimonas sp.]
MNVRPTRSIKGQRGFSLLEVLIGLLVLSIGLLGIAGLQTIGMKSSHNAYLGSQAAALAYDMADRVRANPDANYVDTSDGCDNPDSVPSSPVRTADFAEWSCLLVSLLPAGAGTVEDLDNDTFRITVAWDGDAAEDDGSAERLSYILRVRL